jgi:hypothetical protein
LSSAKSFFGRKTSPRTSSHAGAPSSFFGRPFKVATFGVTSSPTAPSPRVAART